MEGFVEGANNNSCNFESRILLHQKDHFVSSIGSSRGGQESDSALKGVVQSWFFVEVSDLIFSSVSQTVGSCRVLNSCPLISEEY